MNRTVNFAASLPLSWRMLGREWRAGELRLIFVALLLAVAAVTAVGFLTDRLNRALQGEAAQLLGADLILTADQPLPAEFAAEAEKRGLRTAQIQLFPSMVFANERAQLVEVKAVDAHYPLRGKLHVAAAPGTAEQASAHGPQAGTAWVDARLFQQLALTQDALLGVGQLHLPVRQVLTGESDRAFNFFSLSPRLMLSLDDVQKSGLTAFGARVTYRLQLAGEAAGGAAALAGWRAWAEPRLSRGQRLEGLDDAQPEVRKALDQASRFLGLASLLTVLLAAIAVALAARRYLARHLDTCALLRCFGMAQGQVLRLHLVAFFLLALFAAVAGSLLGFAAHFALVAGLSGLFSIPLPWPGVNALGQGVLVAFVLLFGFVLPPILQLARVPTVRVLRREFGPPAVQALLAWGLGAVLLAALVVLTAGELRLGLLVLGGFAGTALFFAAAAWAVMQALARWQGQRGRGFGVRYGWVSLARHRAANVLNVVALGSGLMALLLLGVTRVELLHTWQQSLPADAPNRFIINIQPEQQAAVAATLAAQGIGAELAPMVRARLTAKNGQPVSAADFPADERAQRLIEREFNLSWRDDLPAGNQITAGRWFAGPGAARSAATSAAASEGEASVEEGLAKTLGIALGDRLEFTVAGMRKTLTVSSLRKLDWDSMRVNFFVLTPSGVLEDAPRSLITSFHLPPQFGPDPLAALVAQFPNLTVIDITAVLTQIQAVLGQIVGVVQLVFLFTLAAGAAVLYAALLAALDARRYEIAVLRALGARRAQLRRALLAELATLGALAGLLAAIGAALVGQVLAQRVFATTAEISLSAPVLSSVLAALGVAGIGWLVLRRLLDTPPLLALRAGG